MPLTQAFSVTGVANTTTFDSDGLVSNENERKKLKGLLVATSGVIGNRVVGNIERQEYVEVYDYNLDTTEASGTNSYKSVAKQSFLPIELEIPVGQKFQAGILCGATNKDLYGAYVYELMR